MDYVVVEQCKLIMQSLKIYCGHICCYCWCLTKNGVGFKSEHKNGTLPSFTDIMVIGRGLTGGRATGEILQLDRNPKHG